MKLKKKFSAYSAIYMYKTLLESQNIGWITFLLHKEWLFVDIILQGVDKSMDIISCKVEKVQEIFITPKKPVHEYAFRDFLGKDF